MINFSKIYIHCSASSWGNVEVIRKWHLERGFQDIGYHFVVTNQFPEYKDFFDFKTSRDFSFNSFTDGQVHDGRPLGIQGAHVKDDNAYSIGICYIGFSPTPAQYNSLLWLCQDLMKRYPLITIDSILGHYEYYTNRGLDAEKTCPNFNMEGFRNILKIHKS